MKELKKCIFNGPYVMTRVHVPVKPATETDLPVPEHTVPETYENTLPENHAYIDAEAKEIHMILSGIKDDIYSIVDACKTAKEMWTSIERLQKGESLNKQDVKTNLFWEFGKFTLRYGESIESYYSRNANHLALVSTAQHYPDDTYYHAPKPHKNLTTSSRHKSSYSYHASTRNKGKEIAKPITHVSQSASEEDSDLEQAQRDNDMQKSIALTAKYFTKIYKPTNNNLRTSSNSINKNVDSTPRIKNDRQTEPDEQELEAHYMYMAKIQEVLYVTDDNFEPIYDTESLAQNADDHDEDEHVELAILIANLKLDIDKNKKIQKQLRCRSALHQKEVDLEKYIMYKNCQLEKEEIEQKEQLQKDFIIRQDNDIDKIIALENQVKFLNDIVYTTNQSVQTIHMLAPNPSLYYDGRTSFVNPMYLKKAQSKKPCLYKVPFDKDDLANLFAPNSDDTLILEQESRSKLDKDKVKPYDYTSQNSL
ncbi:hypothetical protein Tco_1431789 [Tanacetum coccineum]